jgi:flagellar assembly protein FliH
MNATLQPNEYIGDVAPHRLSAVTGPIVGETRSNGPLPHTARDLARVRQQAYDDAYAQAYTERATALDLAAQRLAEICTQLSSPLATVDTVVVETVAELAVSIARHLVRRELKHAPGEVIGVVRDAMRQLPLATRRARIHLHPEDAEIVNEALNLGTDTAWHLEADPLIARGGCIVETESSRIDAQVESRIAAIAAKMFGGERESDRAR